MENNLEKMPSGGEEIPSGGWRASIDRTFKKYNIISYPGPDVVKNGRAEHLPYHCHVNKNGIEWRIELSDKGVNELDGKKIPKDLKEYLIMNKDCIKRNIINVFNTGTF